MADRYWVGAAGNWSDTAKWSTTSGGAGGASVPGAADTAIFDANSDAGANFTATVDTAFTIANLTFTAVDRVITLGTAGNLTVNTATTISASASTNGMLVSGDASLGAITLTSGTLNINGSTISAISYSSDNANTRTLAFGTGGKINITGNNATVMSLTTAGTSNITGTGSVDFTYSGSVGTRTVRFESDGTGDQAININITAGSDTFNISHNSVFNSLNFTGFSGTYTSSVDISIYGSLTFSSGMTVNTSGAGTFFFSATTSQTITTNGKTLNSNVQFNGTGTWTLQDNFTCGTTNQFDIDTGTVELGTNTITSGTFRSTGSTRTINFGTGKIVVNDNSSPGPASIVNCTNISGLTVLGTPLIEIAGTGTGTYPITYGTTGATSARACSFLISKTTAATIEFDGLAFKDITFNASNAVFSLVGNSALYGNFTLTSVGSITSTTNIMSFVGTSGTQDITSNGNSIPFSITVNGAGGTVRLLDALTLISLRTLTLTAGTFNANNYNVTTGLFSGTGSTARTLTMGSGLWSLTGVGTVWTTATTTNLTFNKDTANIILTDTTTSARTFAGGNLTYNKLTIGGATGTSTLSISGTNTFSELASIKTVAHTIQFAANQTVAAWSITGSSGNVVTLNSSVNGTARTLTKTGGGYLTGIDYVSIRDIVGSPVSDTWYVGSNSTYVTTAPNSGYGLFTTSRSANAVIVLTSTASTSFTVPNDWNNADNTIHLIGGGGGGGGSKVSGTNTAGGGGGGGGGYTKLTRQTLTPGSSITYQCGSAGTAGSSGGDGGAGGTTSWNSGASTAGGGGGGTSNAATPSSTGGAAGTGTTFNGGVGGAGSTTTANATTGVGGGGGAGAAGVNGAGKNGGVGFSSTTATSIAGGGGGGADGGTAGGNASAATGGTGGNNFSGVGGGASNTGGAVGGGGGGGTSATVRGGSGVQIFGVGSGGGGGGADDGTRTNTGGAYGGGGCGAGQAIGTTTLTGSAGSQGAIIIVYSTGSGNFLQLFN